MRTPSWLAWSLLPLLVPALLVTATSDQSGGFPKVFGWAQTQPGVLVQPSSPHSGVQPAPFSEGAYSAVTAKIPFPSVSQWETIRGCRVFSCPLLVTKD